MATNTISKLTSIVKENKSISVEFLQNGTPAVRSDVVAAHFDRSHKNVLRDIAKLRSKCPKLFYGLNFEPVDYVDPKGEKRPAYHLTRDAFSLLVMGFTGAAAVAWKLKYIEAFNSLEAAVLHNQTELAHQAGYQQGLDEARALPAAEADRKVAYLQGMKEGKKLQKRRDGLALTRKAVNYRKKGLSLRDTARLLSMPTRTLADLLVRARTLGVQA
ncbi:MAG: Rha family transcriptional regulator [Desulfovibrionaceae bacterium]